MSAISPESEKAVLGAILFDERYQATLLACVSTDDLALSSHREILRAVLTLKKQHKTDDLVTVAEELGRTGKLDSVGGAAYIGSLIDSVPDKPNLEAYAANIRQAARARALHAAAGLACTSIEQGDPADEVWARLQDSQAALSFTDTRGAQKLFVAAPQFIAQAPQGIDWLVEGVIERGSNGFFLRCPKVGRVGQPPISQFRLH